MKVRIASLGLICSLIWGAITKMTFGIPLSVCEFIDKITFHVFSREIYQMGNGFHYDVDNNDMPTIAFFVLFWVIFILVFYAMKLIERHPGQKGILGLVIFYSILFRLIALPGVAVHENDFYRYLWDGKASSNQINPYKYAPADLFMYENAYSEDYYDQYHGVTIKARAWSQGDRKNLDHLIQLRDKNPTFYNRIGHWQVPTIYPPLAQATFLLAASIKTDSIVLLKLLFVFFDIAALFVIIGILRHFKRDPSLSLIYGWSPLVVMQVANTGHYDSIAIFLTMLSVYFFLKRDQFLGVGNLALATLTKMFSAVLLPIFVRSLRIRHITFFTALILLMYIPFFMWDQTGVRGVFLGLNTYNAEWFYNASIASLVYVIYDTVIPRLTESYFPTKLTVGLGYLTFISILALKRSGSGIDLVHKCFLAIAVLFLVSPVGDPWYFCWSIPFLCLFRYRSWLYLSGLLVFSYLNFHSDLWINSERLFNVPLTNYVIYVPFFLYLAFESIGKPNFNNECQQEESKGSI